MISSKAKYRSTQSLPSKHCVSVFGNPISLSFFAKSDGESVISSSLFANPPYFDENLRDFEIEAVKQNLGPSLLLKKLRTRLPKKNVEVCVSFVRIQRNIFANFVHSPESSTLRRRISSYLWSRGLTRWPKSFPQGQQFLKTRSQKARRCIQRSHPSSSARELLYRAN